MNWVFKRFPIWQYNATFIVIYLPLYMYKRQNDENLNIRLFCQAKSKNHVWNIVWLIGIHYMPMVWPLLHDKRSAKLLTLCHLTTSWYSDAILFSGFGISGPYLVGKHLFYNVNVQNQTKTPCVQLLVKWPISKHQSLAVQDKCFIRNSEAMRNKPLNSENTAAFSIGSKIISYQDTDLVSSFMIKR